MADEQSVSPLLSPFAQGEPQGCKSVFVGRIGNPSYSSCDDAVDRTGEFGTARATPPESRGLQLAPKPRYTVGEKSADGFLRSLTQPALGCPGPEAGGGQGSP